MTLSEELDLLVASIESVPSEKRYWLIRTQSGSLYESFRENGVVALEHNEVPLSFLGQIRKEFSEDAIKTLAAIRSKVRSVHEGLLPTDSSEELNVRKAGLISSQIFKFVFEIKKGDTVIIPSFNSDIVSFGIITEDYIGSFSQEEIRKIEVDAILKRRVKWIKDIKRIDLDPYLYRMFLAHQALNEVGSYADVIERSLKDFFILDNEAHVIINVETEKEIPAPDLFGLGSEILRLVDAFAEMYHLDISSRDLHVTVTLNSPGKIDLKSKIKRTTVVTGLILAVFGGGYETKDGTSIKSPGLPGLIKAIDEFRTHEQERGMKQQVFDTYKDSLEVKQPEDMIRLLKQFSDNKDISK